MVSTERGSRLTFGLLLARIINGRGRDGKGRSAHRRKPETAPRRGGGGGAYLTSESILNIGRYIAMMITPTIRPTPIIITGSMMLVSVAIDASTSSS